MRNSLMMGAGAVIGVNALPQNMVCGYEFVAENVQEQDDTSPEKDKDRMAVMSAGFTEAEADCWKQTAKAAAAFFALPELHPMDDHEVASAIHVIQNKLLGRPTYRKYLKEAKRLYGDKLPPKPAEKGPSKKA